MKQYIEDLLDGVEYIAHNIAKIVGNSFYYAFFILMFPVFWPFWLLGRALRKRDGVHPMTRSLISQAVDDYYRRR